MRKRQRQRAQIYALGRPQYLGLKLITNALWHPQVVLNKYSFSYVLCFYHLSYWFLASTHKNFLDFSYNVQQYCTVGSLCGDEKKLCKTPKYIYNHVCEPNLVQDHNQLQKPIIIILFLIIVVSCLRNSFIDILVVLKKVGTFVDLSVKLRNLNCPSCHAILIITKETTSITTTSSPRRLANGVLDNDIIQLANSIIISFYKHLQDLEDNLYQALSILEILTDT